MVEGGTAVVKNYILVNGNASSETGGGGGTVEGPNNNLTGSATGTAGMQPGPTPSPFTGGVGRVEKRGWLGGLLVGLVGVVAVVVL